MVLLLRPDAGATLSIASGAYLLVVALATILPALQALRVDPASALRAE